MLDVNFLMMWAGNALTVFAVLCVIFLLVRNA